MIQSLRILGEINPVFVGRVLIELNTYPLLDEGLREMLIEHGLLFMSLKLNKATCIDFNF